MQAFIMGRKGNKDTIQGKVLDKENTVKGTIGRGPDMYNSVVLVAHPTVCIRSSVCCLSLSLLYSPVPRLSSKELNNYIIYNIFFSPLDLQHCNFQVDSWGRPPKCFGPLWAFPNSVLQAVFSLPSLVEVQ
jgi:hypothetical protein